MRPETNKKMANPVITRWLLDFIPDVVEIAFFFIIILAIIATAIWQIIAKCHKTVSKTVTTPEQKGLLQSRQAGY